MCSSITLSVSFMTGLSCPLTEPLCDCPIATVRTVFGGPVFDGAVPIVEIGGCAIFSGSWGASKGEVILDLSSTSEALAWRPNCDDGSTPTVGEAILGSVGVGSSSWTGIAGCWEVGGIMGSAAGTGGRGTVFIGGYEGGPRGAILV